LLINVGLGIFNLIPIPPLDGSKILRGFMPDKSVHIIDYLERYGGIILLAIVFLGRITGFSVFGKLLGPLINGLVHFFSGIQL
jgi:Zn-dependent protease